MLLNLLASKERKKKDSYTADIKAYHQTKLALCDLFFY
jgi:hypothetical protein